MAQIHTYHCLCTSLLLSTTHALSTLPTRQSTSTTSDNAIILPLPASPPSSTNDKAPENILPRTGYTILLGLQADSKTTIIRREDGFEKRILYRCGRCGVVVGYEIASSSRDETMDVDGAEGEKNEVYSGKIVYILPGGLMSTKVMRTGGIYGGSEGETEQKIGEGSLDIVGRKAVNVFE